MAYLFSLPVGVGDNASFTIVANQLRSAEVFDFETKASYNVTVRATDLDTGLYIDRAFVVQVQNQNEAPNNIFISADDLDEGLAIGTEIATVSGEDPDTGDVLTFSLPVGIGDNASFTLTGTSLKSAEVFDYSVKSEYTITLRATDALGLTYDRVFTIFVNSMDTLDYLDEAEISLMTADTTGLQTHQLTAVGEEMGNINNLVVWSSSNESAITVSGLGLVTCVGAGTATITATRGAVSKTCTITGFATMPDATARYALKGGKVSATSFEFNTTITAVLDPQEDLRSCLYIVRTSRSSTDGPIVRHAPWASQFPVFDIGDIDGRLSVGTYSVGAAGGFTRDLYQSVTGIVPNGVFYAKVYANGSTATLNGVSVPLTFVNTDSGTVPNRVFMDFFSPNRSEKTVLLSLAALNTPSADLENAPSCKLFHTPQCYIRKTDTDSRTNYTIIPNLGTLGTAYNLVANNVPAGWFAV
jgi:hypothetical protein